MVMFKIKIEIFEVQFVSSEINENRVKDIFLNESEIFPSEII